MKKFLAVIMLLFSFSVFAEQYKVIVPYAAGATPDVQARKIFATVSKNTGDTFVVFNKGGAETLLGYKYFLEESSNDKNVLYISHTSYYNIFLNDDEKFSIDKNSKSVATIQKFTYSLVTRKDSTLEDISQIPCLKAPAKTQFVGIGYDIHSFEDKKEMFLGGVKLPYDYGFKAHKRWMMWFNSMPLS